jgi:hypothetical protein
MTPHLSRIVIWDGRSATVFRIIRAIQRAAEDLKAGRPMPADDATAAFSQEMMQAAHKLKGPTHVHEILTTAELIAALLAGSSIGGLS